MGGALDPSGRVMSDGMENRGGAFSAGQIGDQASTADGEVLSGVSGVYPVSPDAAGSPAEERK